MYQVKITKTFRKDTERCRKRGYNMELLKEAVRILEAEGKLPSTYRPHKLSGNLEGCWECHLKGDWLLFGNSMMKNSCFSLLVPEHIPICLVE